MSDDLTIPVFQEDAHVEKRSVEIERVSVRTFTDEEQVVVRDEVRRERVDVTRVPIDREIEAAPPVRTEGEVTIIPVLEERLVVTKRLILVEELHLRRTGSAEPIELPTTLRRTRVEIERSGRDPQETH